MARTLQLGIALMALSLGTALAEAEDPLGGGSIDESGKFIPAETGSDTPSPMTSWDAKHVAEMTKSLIRRSDDGRVRIGEVSIDEKARSLSFPAKLNQREGPIEYALVTPKGKAHEALLVTSCSPWHIQLAALLLDLASPEKGVPPKNVEVLVEWDTNGPRRSHRLEELVALAKDSPYGEIGGLLPEALWSYSGSQIGNDGFAADREGNLITLIGDPASLILNEGPTRADDSLHVPNAQLLPLHGHPVTVVVRSPRKKFDSN